MQKDDGRYPNRLAFLITDCNLFVSVSDKKPLHAGAAYVSCETKVVLVTSWSKKNNCHNLTLKTSLMQFKMKSRCGTQRLMLMRKNWKIIADLSGQLNGLHIVI